MGLESTPEATETTGGELDAFRALAEADLDRVFIATEVEPLLDAVDDAPEIDPPAVAEPQAVDSPMPTPQELRQAFLEGFETAAEVRGVLTAVKAVTAIQEQLGDVELPYDIVGDPDEVAAFFAEGRKRYTALVKAEKAGAGRARSKPKSPTPKGKATSRRPAAATIADAPTPKASKKSKAEARALEIVERRKAQDDAKAAREAAAEKKRLRAERDAALDAYADSLTVTGASQLLDYLELQRAVAQSEEPDAAIVEAMNAAWEEMPESARPKPLWIEKCERALRAAVSKAKRRKLEELAAAVQEQVAGNRHLVWDLLDPTIKLRKWHASNGEEEFATVPTDKVDVPAELLTEERSLRILEEALFEELDKIEPDTPQAKRRAAQRARRGKNRNR